MIVIQIRTKVDHLALNTGTVKLPQSKQKNGRKEVLVNGRVITASLWQLKLVAAPPAHL